MAAFWSAPTSKHAYILSWFSVVVTFICFIAGVLLYLRTGSSLCLVFGVDNSVDLLSSVIVLWRFFVPNTLTDEVEKKLHKREERASMAISLIMGLLGIGVIIAAVDDFLQGEEGVYLQTGVFRMLSSAMSSHWIFFSTVAEPTHQQLILGLSFFSVIISGTMALFKFNYSAHLSSPSLFKDGICSTIGAVLGAALFFNTLILRVNTKLWWIDPVVSLICGFFALFMAGQAIYLGMCIQGLPICSARWWFFSEGEVGGETTGDSSEPQPKESEIV